MKTRKILALLLSGMLAVSGLAGCGGTESQEPQASDTKSDIKLSFIVSYKDEYLGSLDMAVKAAAESKNCTLSSTDCADDMDKQIEYVRAAASSGSDAAIVVLVDDNRAQEVVEAAGDMKVVFVNRIPQDDAVIDSDHVYIGSNEYTAGTEQGKMLANALKQAGYIALIGLAKDVLEQCIDILGFSAPEKM